MKYANLALRVTASQARLPALSGVIEGLLAGDEAARAERGVRNAQSKAAAKTNDKGPMTSDLPPVEDCSPDAECGARNAELEASTSIVTAVPTKTSERLSAEKRAARRAFLAAAQPLLSPDPSLALRASGGAETRPAELRITPETLELTAKPASGSGNQHERKLSRRERKRVRKAR